MTVYNFNDYKKKYNKRHKKKYRRHKNENYLLDALLLLIFILAWSMNNKFIDNTIVIGVVSLFFTAILFIFIAKIIKKHKERMNYKNLSQEQIDILSGKDFEKYLRVHFENLGYKVKLTPDTNDYGADLLVTRGSERMVIQAKRYAGKVGNKAVQEVIGALHYYNCNKAMVVTNSFFTPNAKKMAEKCDVILWDRNTLKKLFKIRG